MATHVWAPVGGIFLADWIGATVQIVLCTLVVLFFVLNWDIDHVRITFFPCLIAGIVIVFLFGNLAGILILIALILIIIKGD